MDRLNFFSISRWLSLISISQLYSWHHWSTQKATTTFKRISKVIESRRRSLSRHHGNRYQSHLGFSFHQARPRYHLHDSDHTSHFRRLQKLRELHRKYVNVAELVVASHYTSPRHTIVLCHGLFGYDKINMNVGFIPIEFHYWKGIKEGLEKMGAKVIIPRVPRCGSIRQRAMILASFLEEVCAGESINFIAHSMGGLDCRHLITHIPQRSFQIASLTTIATPHRGSPFMDWCRDTIGVGSKLDASTEEHALSQFRKRLISWIDTPAYSNLTTDFLHQTFNPTTPNDPNVEYFSYGAAYSIGLLSPLRLPFEIVHKQEGQNDGLVSVPSSKWGRYMGTVSADHWDLVNSWGLMGKLAKPITRSDFNVVDFYLDVATKIYREGH